MTFAEKYQVDHPGSAAGDCLKFCPRDFGYEKESICGTMTCYECWNREIPEEATHG